MQHHPEPLNLKYIQHNHEPLKLKCIQHNPGATKPQTLNPNSDTLPLSPIPNLLRSTTLTQLGGLFGDFFFFFTLVTGPRRSLSLKLNDTRVYEPQIRARLGTIAHFCKVVVGMTFSNTSPPPNQLGEEKENEAEFFFTSLAKRRVTPWRDEDWAGWERERQRERQGKRENESERKGERERGAYSWTHYFLNVGVESISRLLVLIYFL